MRKTRGKLVRMGIDPMMACCLMWPTDKQVERAESAKSKVSDHYGWDSTIINYEYEKYRSAKEMADEISGCGFNTVFIVGKWGSNLKPEDIRSKRYRDLVTALHARRIAVGQCLPFADTLDNLLTKTDPKLHQKLIDGKLPYVGFNIEVDCPKGAIYIIDYGAKGFIDFAKDIIDAAKEVGVDFIDYAEPDYWPVEGNGYGDYLRDEWKRKYAEDLPALTNIKHRVFMEDYHLSALTELSNYIHSKGMSDHLTASPMAHAPDLICQNYGKYSTTPVTELSSTYHHPFGLSLKQRLKREHDVIYDAIKISGVACIEVKFMREWERRHAIYMGIGKEYSLETYKYTIDEQLFLHNMDFVLWEYPMIKWLPEMTDYSQIRKVYRERFNKYLSLPSEYHLSIPYPAVLFYFSKRGVYINPSIVSRCFYCTGLKLLGEHLPFGVIYDEYPAPLTNRKYNTNMLILCEDHPLSPLGWREIKKWFGRGKILLYAGGPGFNGEDGTPLNKLPYELGDILGIYHHKSQVGQEHSLFDLPKGMQGLGDSLPKNLKSYPIQPHSGTKILLKRNGIPLVTIRGDFEKGYAVYVAAPVCQLPQVFLSDICHFLLKLVGRESVNIESLLDIEIYPYRNRESLFLSARNHSCESGKVKFVLPSVHPKKIKEILNNQTIRLGKEKKKIEFTDIFLPKEVKIYHLNDCTGL